MKAVQYFSKEYLGHCETLSTGEILEFLENFRLLNMGGSKSKLISIKIQESLLEAFKTKARLQGIPYQTQMKVLMEEWLKEEHPIIPTELIRYYNSKFLAFSK